MTLQRAKYVSIEHDSSNALVGVLARLESILKDGYYTDHETLSQFEPIRNLIREAHFQFEALEQGIVLELDGGSSG